MKSNEKSLSFEHETPLLSLPKSISNSIKSTIFLGIIFMVLFSAFNTAQNMISQIYSQKLNLPYLGNLTLIVIYISFSVSNFFIAKILEKFSFKWGMFFASWAYVLFLAVGVLAFSCEGNPENFFCSEFWLVSLNLITAAILGPMACILWVSQIGYISGSCDNNSKSRFFGVFFAFYQLSQLFGSLITAFSLEIFDHFGYFLILLGLGILSSLLFLFLPKVEKTTEQMAVKSFREKIQDFSNCLKSRDFQYFAAICVFSGAAIGFYAGYFHKIISGSIETSNDNNQINQKTSYVFICLGVFEFVGGMWSSLFVDKLNRFSVATGATLIYELGLFFVVIAYYEKKYLFCFLGAGCWGMADSILNSTINAILTTHFGNKIEYFANYVFWQEVGIFMSLGASLMLDGGCQMFYFIFLSILLAIANLCAILMKK